MTRTVNLDCTKYSTAQTVQTWHYWHASQPGHVSAYVHNSGEIFNDRPHSSTWKVVLEGDSTEYCAVWSPYYGQLSIQLHFSILSRAVEKGLDVEEISQSGISPYRSNPKQQHMASSKLFSVHL